MEKSLVKKAVEEAEKDLQEKQKKEVKLIVLKTLEKINSLNNDRKKAKDTVKELDAKIKLLKMDIEDLKEGRLDRIAERQEKDDEAKKVSVVIIIKEKEVIREYPYWHWPYRITWIDPQPICPSTWTWTVDKDNTSGTIYQTYDGCYYTNQITSSVAKWSTKGSYEVDGNVVNLR